VAAPSKKPEPVKNVKLDEKNKKKTEKANALFAGISGQDEKA
jgi:hypothetical protein